MSTFIHGIEVNFIERLESSFTAPLTSVIALVGTAPLGATNVLSTTSTRREAIENHGEQLAGFTIPYALEAIYKQGGAEVIVVNVYDPALHNVDVVDDPVIIGDGRGKTLFNPATAVVLKSNDGNTTYTLGTDYTIDAYGNVRVLDGTAIADASTALATYERFDPTTVTTAQVNGVTTGNRSGLELLDNALAMFGYYPKIIIAPQFCETAATSLKMSEKADQFGAVYFVDAPRASTVTTVLQGRGPLGGIPGFRTSDKNLQPMFPYVLTLNPQGETVAQPLSPFVAGVAARSDREFGVQRSLSNQELRGVLGADKLFSSNISDPLSDTNRLNRVGVMTVLNSQSRGIVTFGNRNASAPDNTEQDVFMSAQRVKLMLIEALSINNLRFLDRDITTGLVDAMVASNNAYLRGLKSTGVIVDGNVTLDNELTTTAAIAQGRLFFKVEFAAVSPAERLTFTLSFNPDLLAGIIQ